MNVNCYKYFYLHMVSTIKSRLNYFLVSIQKFFFNRSRVLSSETIINYFNEKNQAG